MIRLARCLCRCPLPVCAGIVALAAWLFAPLVAAQPVEWSHRWSSGYGFLIRDPADHFYVSRRNYIDRLDPGGNVLWTVPRGAVCRTCSDIAAIGAADADNLYYSMREYIGPMQCALGCSRGTAYRQPRDGGAAVALYSTPLTTPPVAGVDITAGPNGEVAVVGQDGSSGFLVRLAPTRLELRHGTAMGPAVVTASGDMVVTGKDGTAGFLRRYDVTGAIAWTAPATACSRLAVHPAHGVACLVLAPSSSFGTVDLFDSQGTLLRRALAGDVAAIAFDNSGALWTAGRGCGGGCASLKKFVFPGALVAEATLEDPGETSEWSALSIAPDGDVYTTGLVRPLPAPSFMPSDMLTARHDGSARVLWQARLNGALDWNDAGIAIVATSDGAVALGSLTDTGLYGGAQRDTLIAIKYGRNALVAPSLVLSATPFPVRAGEPVTVTATVSGTLLPSGAVTFGEGATILCASVPLLAASAASASASCSFIPTAAGVRTVQAAYSGDGTYAAADAFVAVTVLAGDVAEVPGPAPWALALVAAALAWTGARRTRIRRDR